jgi:hypothetical protein
MAITRPSRSMRILAQQRFHLAGKPRQQTTLVGRKRPRAMVDQAQRAI